MTWTGSILKNLIGRSKSMVPWVSAKKKKKKNCHLSEFRKEKKRCVRESRKVNQEAEGCALQNPVPFSHKLFSKPAPLEHWAKSWWPFGVLREEWLGALSPLLLFGICIWKEEGRKKLKRKKKNGDEKWGRIRKSYNFPGFSGTVAARGLNFCYFFFFFLGNWGENGVWKKPNFSLQSHRPPKFWFI